MLIPAPLRELATRLHERVVGTGMGDRTKVVLRGIAWVMPAALIARVTTGVTTLLTARWLGPEAWGHAGLALAASLWIQVPLFLGIPAALMNAIPRAEESDRLAWARTGALLLAISGSLTLVGGFLLREPLAAWAGMGVPEFSGGLAWCAGYVVYTAGLASLSGLERFRTRALAEVGFGVIFPALVVVLKLTGLLTWQGYLQAMAGGYALAGLARFVVGGAPAPGIDARTSERVRGLMHFGAVATVSILASALMQAVGRQVISHHFKVEDVGVLAAYQGGSIQVAMYVQALLTMIFFPVASRTPDRTALFRKVTRLLGPLALLSSVGCAAVLLAWMRLLGREYPLDIATVVAFAVAAGLALAFYVVFSMLASAGSRGMAAATFTQLVNGGVNLVACLALIPKFGVLGAGVASAIGMAAGIASAFLPTVRRWAGVA